MESQAKLLFNNKEFVVKARAVVIETITISDGIAVMPVDSGIDIIKLDKAYCSVQSASGGKLIVFQKDSSKISYLKVLPGLHHLKFNRT